MAEIDDNEPCQHRTTRTEHKRVPDEHGEGTHIDVAVYCTDRCGWRIR